MTLHSAGIVHHDLRIDNFIFTPNGLRTCIIDLESRWGNRLEPEISKQPVLDAGWTEKSDIYDLGIVIKGMIYGNTPITNLVGWDVPGPLKPVVEACTRTSPADRPSLIELYDMDL
jgi:serine/threonine protein kinase